MLADFQSLLKAISEKPETYVGSSRLRDIEIFLDGMRFAVLSLAPEEDPFRLWQPWVELRFNIRHPEWRWPRILEHEFKQDEKILRILPDLYELYQRETRDLSEDEMHDKVTSRFRQKFGAEFHTPKDTSPVRQPPPRHNLPAEAQTTLHGGQPRSASPTAGLDFLVDKSSLELAGPERPHA